MSMLSVLPSSLRRLTVAVALVGTLATAQAATATAQVFDPTVHTLENGLEIVVIPNHRAPIVTQMLWYKVGAADEPLGKSGIAHYLEHLMFKGTEKVGPFEFSQLIERHGGRDNAMTSWDFTAYHQTVASEQLEMVMELEADRMRNLRLAEELVLPERDVILEERLSRIDNDPAAQLAEMASAALFVHHPYGTPIIGWEHEIRQLTTEDALDFYETWYVPNNAILIVAGDVEPEEVIRLAETHYGPISSGTLPERTRVAEPKQWAPRRVELTSPRVGQASFSIRYLAPSYHRSLDDSAPEAAYALQVASELLSGATGRLYRRLVVEQEIAASAGASYSPTAYDLTTFTFWGSPRPEVEPEQVEEAIRAEIDLLLEEGVNEREVERAKQRLLDSAVFARDSVAGPAYAFGMALTAGGSVEEVETWPERVREVTAEQVEAALALVIRSERSVTSVLRPEPTS
ncbi:MAG TPA: pitrilysin family protein [Kiloniellales bacterium]|jgi:zinc protease|nr:pitrilysin family protein [Kiloniellales bacterium]